MEDARYAQDALNRADVWINNGDGSRVNVTEGAFNPDGKLVAGAANTDSGYMYLDLGEGSRGSIVNTLIHEGMHLDGAGDRMADLTGWLGDATYRLNAWANSGQIAQHHAVVPVQNQYLHRQLLNQNNAGFANDAVNGALLYRQLNRSEIAAVHGPENQALYQDVRARFGLEPSDDPGRDLYLAAMNRVDAGSAELLSPDFVSELVIDHLATQSSGAGEAYHNSSGSRGGLFEVTASDYVDPQVNSTALWNEESFNDFPIKSGLLSGLGEMGQHDLYSGVYLPAMEHASAESADALSQQTAMIFGGALLTPAAASALSAPLVQGGLAWWGLNDAVQGEPFIPGPLGGAGRAVPGSGVVSDSSRLTAAQEAAAWQGSPRFPGVDRWRDINLKQGTVIYAGEPGLSGFMTTESAIRRAGGDAKVLFDGLQVPPRAGLYRPGVTAFEVLESIPAAMARTRGNDAISPGGLPQLYLPSVNNVTRTHGPTPSIDALINEGKIRPLVSYPLNNRKKP